MTHANIITCKHSLPEGHSVVTTSGLSASHAGCSFCREEAKEVELENLRAVRDAVEKLLVYMPRIGITFPNGLKALEALDAALVKSRES